MCTTNLHGGEAEDHELGRARRQLVGHHQPERDRGQDHGQDEADRVILQAAVGFHVVMAVAVIVVAVAVGVMWCSLMAGLPSGRQR
jgi:hypothetical protein